jgi:hypothetical protein
VKEEEEGKPGRVEKKNDGTILIEE